MILVGVGYYFIYWNLNVGAKRTQKSSHAEPGKEWVPQQYQSADTFFSFQNDWLPRGIFQKSITTLIKASPFYSENLKVQKLAESSQGQNSLQLIQELLQFYEMEHSLKIFNSESNMKNEVKR